NMAKRSRRLSKAAKTIGVIGYDGVQALDIAGPVDAFSIAASHLAAQGGNGAAAYEVRVLGVSRRAFTAESGMAIRPHGSLKDAPPLDTVIVPGGRGLRLQAATRARVAAWLQEHASRIRRVVSVCTGIYALAPTGLLDGRRVTTHWRFAADIARKFPRLRVEPNALFVQDGAFYTSAGITAGIDLALALIEEDHGREVALGVARDLVVYLKRPGGQEQFSEPLQFQTQARDRFSDLAPWINAHLHRNLTVPALAERACLSPRQFTRRFKQAFGVTPGEFVENLRLDEARRRLSASSVAIEGVADSVGFASADSFRRAFERRFGVAPSIYRRSFSQA
ncbi:MAG TPA: GlxA family transcriptional regulator, partial [Terriglobales bacterium]|nr:GlxA family transcriptional regulator [Terriglobales bacterium]